MTCAALDHLMHEIKSSTYSTDFWRFSCAALTLRGRLRLAGMDVKRVTFFRNGDPFCAGRTLVVTERKYGSWDALMTEIAPLLGLGACRL